MNGIKEKIAEYFFCKGLSTEIAAAFNDVFIVDLKSDINSRGDIKSLRTRLAKDIYLNVPIVSANMPDVTESKMAIALARLGGCGFIHQFMPIERRVEEILKVKRVESEVIESPTVIMKEKNLGEAKKLMAQNQISSLLVVDNDGKLIGILTSRDIRFEQDQQAMIEALMTPLDKLITAAPDISIGKAREMLKKTKIEKLPLVNAEGYLKGLITAKDILKSQHKSARDSKRRLLVGATVGIKDTEKIMNEINLLSEAGTDMILVDTARGFSNRVEELIKAIKIKFPAMPLIVGNVDNADGCSMLIEAGADAVKVGIGPGSACKTREETGIGAPQLTAVAECVAVAKDFNIPVIADGGIRCDADFAKALGAGANCVMLGGLLAGVKESPGEPFYDEGKQWKLLRGSASLEAQASRIDQGSLDHIRPSEGVPRRVPYKGELAVAIADMLGHLRSSMSYVGAHNLEDFRKKVKFRMQSIAGYMEGKPQTNF